MRPARLLMAFLVSVLALTASAGAQSVSEGGVGAPTPKPAPIPIPIPRARIVGTVICSDTRQPARGAKLMLMPVPTAGKGENQAGGMRPMMGIVGVDGTFSLEHVLPGEYVLIGFLPGYTSPFDTLADADVDGPDAQAAFIKKLAGRGTVHVAPDGSTRADLVLERGAAVSGRVVYADGAPATQIAIELEDTAATATPAKNGEHMNVGAMMRMFFNHQSAGTDDLGRFRIAGIMPASYRVRAVETVSAPGSDAGDGLYMMIGMVTDPHATRVYAGDTPHRKAAKVYELHAGDELSGIEIRLPIDGFHTVNGTVTATDGRAVNMGQLTLTDTADDTLRYSTDLRSDGTFAIPHVPPGTYTLAAKDVHVGAPPPGLDPAVASDPRFFQPTNAFAEASVAVIVKEGDVSGADLSLEEVPMPVNPADPVNGDQNADQKIVPAAPED